MTSEDIENAREAYRQQHWSEAFARLSDPKVSASLGFEDLRRLAIAAHMLGRPQERQAAGERAYHAALDEGDLVAAATAAFWVGFGHLEYGEVAQAGGWLARSGGLLEQIGEPTVVHGYLLLPIGLRSLGEGAIAEAREAFEAMGRIGRQFDDPDLVTFSLLGLGDCLIQSGRKREGIGLLDEAMLAVTSGEVSPEVVGLAYCAAIESYQQAFDLRRAQEWTSVLSGWCEAQPDAVPFRGRCMVYRTELMVLHGQWDAAADEVRRAHDRLAGPPPAPPPALGEADYQQAELDRLQGSFAAAAAGYRRAAEHGRQPEPGRALLRLAQGRLASALATIRRALDETANTLARQRLLGPYVEILIAVGELEDARAAATELGQLAVGADSRLLDAIATGADGAVRLASGDHAEALVSLRRSWAAWQEVDAAYEAARLRVLIALACRALGDEETAAIELEAAGRVFSDLGAGPDLARVRRAFGEGPGAGGAQLTGREVEVLRLLAAGRTNREIAGELVISERTVDRHVSNLFSKLDVPSRSAATAYAYEHGIV
jgi:DNA-binding NarL/FixJ family response regulator